MNTEKLEQLGACEDAVQWASEQESEDQAWRDCPRGDWMLWLCGKMSGEPESDGRRKFVLATCACARLSLKFVQVGELRTLKAIETAEAWARGEGGVSLDDVRKDAADAVCAAGYAAAYAATCAAAYSAAYAAYAAAKASYADAYAAAANADCDTRDKILSECAYIVRQHYPKPPRITKVLER